MAKRNSSTRRTPRHADTAGREAVEDSSTAATGDLIHSLVGRFKGKDSLVGALGRERRLDDLIRSRKLRSSRPG
jgi:hypothetical protein